MGVQAPHSHQVSQANTLQALVICRLLMFIQLTFKKQGKAEKVTAPTVAHHSHPKIPKAWVQALILPLTHRAAWISHNCELVPNC